MTPEPPVARRSPAITEIHGDNPGADLYEGDLHAIPLRHLRGAVEVVVGGPPCQPWSSGGKRLGAGDPRDGWPAFLRALDEVRPAAFLAENVAGFAAGARRPAFHQLLGELGGRGYVVEARVVNAADVGVPSREAHERAGERMDRAGRAAKCVGGAEPLQVSVPGSLVQLVDDLEPLRQGSLRAY